MFKRRTQMAPPKPLWIDPKGAVAATESSTHCFKGK